MEIEAPTFNSLNKPQKRALILRDQLRYTDARHLDSFIEGLTDDEPPTYRTVNGGTQPPLELVTLKNSATRFDLGNVLFPEENNAIYRVYLTVEDGRFEMHTEEGLPQDDANLQSVPIHGFIAKTMVPMFKDKFQAILARQNKINEARRAAFDTPLQPPTHFHEGQTLTRLDPTKTQSNGETALTKRPNKRKPGDVVVKHPCNKRTRTGLESIPDTMKSAAFNTIPEHIKVDLFNTISNTAFPHFDNLMTASWNVVSVYSAVGTDFPELHKAIVELKHVLSDFDEAFGLKIDRADVRYRAEFDPAKRTRKDGQRALLPASALNTTQDGVDVGGQANAKSYADKEALEMDVDNAVTGGHGEQTADIEHSMPPPCSLQSSPNPEEEEKSEEDSFEDLITPGRSAKDHHTQETRANSRSRPETSNVVLVDSTHSSPALPPRSKKARDQTAEAATPSPSSDTTSPELARRREEYASSISKTNKHTSAAAAATARESLEPVPAPKNKKTLANLTTSQLHQKYKDRKQNLIQSYGSIASAPPSHRELMRQIEDTIKAREREEVEAARGASEHVNPYAGRQKRPFARNGVENKGSSSAPLEVDSSSAGAEEHVRPRGGSLAPPGTASSPRRPFHMRVGLAGGNFGLSSASESPRRAPIPGVGMAGSFLGSANLGTSMLGPKKQLGSAPVAPMVPGRKDVTGAGNGHRSDGGSGRGNGHGKGGGHKNDNGNGNGSRNDGGGGEPRRGPHGSFGRF